MPPRFRSFQAIILLLIISVFHAAQPVYATALMPQCGEESWAVTNHQIKLDGNYEIASVVDQAQNLIVVTTTKGTGNNRHEWVTLKYSAQGQLLWRYVYPGPGDANVNYDDQGDGAKAPQKSPTRRQGEIANAPPGLILQIAAPLVSQGTYVLGDFRDNSAAGFQLMVQRYQAPLLPLQADLQSIRIKEAIDQPTVAHVPVVLSTISQQAVTLGYSTQPATASAATDYIQQAGTLTIPAGQRLGAIDITIAADAQVENPERFYIRLDSVQAGIAGNSRATVTILDATAQELFLPVVANR